MKAIQVAQLKALEVPWMVSPSLPELCLKTEDVDGRLSATVSFVGFFGEGTSTCVRWGMYRRIEVVFVDVLYARLFPEFSAVDQQRIDGYDWSRIPEFRDASGGFEGSIERTRVAWHESKICPSPSSYIVEGSDVIRSLNLSSGEFSHVLFMGHDFNVEVIAKCWDWRIVGEELSSVRVPHYINKDNV